MRRGAVFQGQDGTEGREGGRGVSERSHLLKERRKKRKRRRKGAKERKEGPIYPCSSTRLVTSRFRGRRLPGGRAACSETE